MLENLPSTDIKTAPTAHGFPANQELVCVIPDDLDQLLVTAADTVQNTVARTIGHVYVGDVS